MRQIRRFRFFTPRLFGDCGASLSIHASNSRCDFESSHGWHARTMLPNTVAPFLITGTTWSQRRTSRLPQKAQQGSGSQRLKYSTTSCFSLTPNCRSRRQSRSNLSRHTLRAEPLQQGPERAEADIRGRDRLVSLAFRRVARDVLIVHHAGSAYVWLRLLYGRSRQSASRMWHRLGQ